MPERIERRYTTDLDVSDGRTIIGRCVPYNEPTTVADPPDFVPYTEVVRPGAFGRFLRAHRSGRFRLTYEHQMDPLSVLASADELVEHDDGLHGTFRALDGRVGDQAIELVRSGTCTGLSVSALVLRSRTLEDGTVERTRLELVDVTLTANPAYSGAVVTALRSVPDGTLDDLDSPLVARALARSAELRARFPR